VGYVAVGTTFGAIAANTRMREVMLPVLQFPIAVPVFIAGIEASTGALKGDPPAHYIGWIKLEAGFAVVFTVLSYLLFEYVLEE
jgi:heme exporter protein B